MTQVSKYPISKNVSDRIFELFLSTLIEIKNKEEAEQFISDFLTPTEKVMLAKRLAIAFLLEKGHEYRTIQQIIRVSAPTITSVNIARQYGNQGYSMVIKKIMKEEKLLKLLDNTIVTLLSAPSTLERGKGTWSYLKQQAEIKRKSNRKAF